LAAFDDPLPWLRRQEPTTTRPALQGQLETLAAYDNTIRPHRTAGRRTPIGAFQARPRMAPTGHGLMIPTHFRVQRDRVDKVGRITLRHNSRLHHFGLGRHHSGTRVLLLIADLEIRVLTEHGGLLRDPPSIRPATTNHNQHRDLE
jgi:hypothetical protein